MPTLQNKLDELTLQNRLKRAKLKNLQLKRMLAQIEPEPEDEIIDISEPLSIPPEQQDVLTQPPETELPPPEIEPDMAPMEPVEEPTFEEPPEPAVEVPPAPAEATGVEMEMEEPEPEPIPEPETPVPPDLSLSEQEREYERFSKMGQEIKKRGLTPYQAAQKNVLKIDPKKKIIGKIGQAWYETMDELQWKRIKGWAVGALRGMPMDDNTRVGYEYFQEKRRLEDEEAEKLKQEAVDILGAEEVKPALPSRPPAEEVPREAVRPEEPMAAAAWREADISEAALKEPLEYKPSSRAQILNDKWEQKIKQIPWKELGTPAGDIVGELLDFAPAILVQAWIASGAISLTALEGSKYAKLLHDVNRLKRGIDNLSPADKLKMERMVARASGKTVGNLIKAKEMDAASKMIMLNRSTQLSSQFIRSLPGEVFLWTNAEAKTRGKNPTLEDYRRATEMIAALRLGGAAVKAWKARKPKTKLPTVTREPTPGPAREAPAGTASPGAEPPVSPPPAKPEPRQRMSFEEFEGIKDPALKRRFFERNPVTGRPGTPHFERNFLEASQNQTAKVAAGAGDINGFKVYDDILGQGPADELNAKIYDTFDEAVSKEAVRRYQATETEKAISYSNLHGDENAIVAKAGQNPRELAELIQKGTQAVARIEVEIEGKMYNPTMKWRVETPESLKQFGEINPKDLPPNTISYYDPEKKIYVNMEAAPVPEDRIVTRDKFEKGPGDEKRIREPERAPAEVREPTPERPEPTGEIPERGKVELPEGEPTVPEDIPFSVGRESRIRKYLATKQRKSYKAIKDDEVIAWHKAHRKEEPPTVTRTGSRDPNIVKKEKAERVARIKDRMEREDSEFDIPQQKVKIKDIPKEFTVDGEPMVKFRTSWNFKLDPLKKNQPFHEDVVYIDKPEGMKAKLKEMEPGEPYLDAEGNLIDPTTGGIIFEPAPKYEVKAPTPKKLLKEYGTTKQWSESMFFFPEGQMLKAPGPLVIHSDVAGGPRELYKLIDNGAIRVRAWEGALEMMNPPTSKQAYLIRDFVSDNNGKVLIDLWNKDMTKSLNQEYPEGTNYKKVLKDITDFYAGKMPAKVSQAAEWRTIREPAAKYDDKKDTINLKNIKLPKGSPLKPFQGADMNIPANLPTQLKIHKGTAWERETMMNLEYRREILDIMNGRKPKTSHIERLKGQRMLKYLKKGEKGGWDYLKVTGVLGAPTKPRYAVNSSLTNCEPSPDCANFCYVTKELNYKWGTSRSKSELIDIFVEKNPEEMGRLIARQFKGLLDFRKDMALRLFDKGDLNPQWVKVIKAINDKGVRVQVFSKKPELLQQLHPKNIRLLSIDSSNMELAEGNDLPVSFIYGGSKDLPLLEKLKDRIQVILPIKYGRRVMNEKEVAQLPDWSKRYQCPIDTGRKKLPSRGTNDGWTCSKCDRGGGVGCYAFQPTTGKEFRVTSKMPTQLEAKELMKYAEENLTPQQYRRVLGQLRGIVKGIREPQPGREIPFPEAISEAPGRGKPGPVEQVTTAYTPQQIDLFDPKPIPPWRLDKPTKDALIKAKKNTMKLATQNRKARGWLKKFIDTGYLNLMGIPVRTKQNIDDLISKVQVWRNPMYETFRVLFIKNDKVTRHMAYSSKMPGFSRTMPDKVDKILEHIKSIRDTMDKLGADSIILLHNHPGAKVSASPADLESTRHWRQIFQDKLKYHLIINHRKYNVISREGAGLKETTFTLPGESPDPYTLEDVPEIRNPYQAVVVSQSINKPEDHIGIVLATGQGKVTGLTSIHKNQFLKNRKQFDATLKNLERDYGSTMTIVAAPEGMELELYQSGLFFDVVSPRGVPMSQEMGLPERRMPEKIPFLKVREEEASYDISPPPDTAEPGKWAAAWERAREMIGTGKARVPKEAVTHYDRWVRETQTRLFELAKLKNDLERMGSKVHREAVPFVIEKTEVPEALGRPDIAKVLSNPEDYAIVEKMVEKAESHFLEMRDYMEEHLTDLPEHWIEDYVTHVWDLKDKKQKTKVVKWFSTRNPQLQKRYIETLHKGVQELGLKPKTLDIADIISIHGQNVIRTTENKLLLDGLVALQDAAGMKLIQPITKAPKEWKTIDHPALMRYAWMGEGEKTISVKGLNQTIIETVEKIKTIETAAGGKVQATESKPMQKLEQVVTGALEARGMTPGESNRYLDRLKAAYAGKEVTAPGEEKITETSERKMQRVLQDIEKKITVKYPRIEKVPVKFHPDLAPLMRAVFASPWRPEGKVGAIVAAWEGANAILKQTQLGISFFHHIALGEAAVAAMGPVKTANVALNLNAMWDALTKGEYSMFLEKYPIARDAVRHGLMLGANLDVQKAVVDKIIEKTGDYVQKYAGKMAAAPLRGLGWGKEKWDQALWDYYHNNLKLLAYETLVARELSRYAKNVKPGETLFDIDEGDISRMKEEIAAFVNDTFGGQNLLAQMADPAWMRLFRAAMLSPDWLVSTLKQAASITGVGTKHKEFKTLRQKMGAKFWLRAAMYFGGASILFNYLNTKRDDAEQRNVPFREGRGKWMWQNDPGHETHIFWRRGKEGEKIYLRHGKQFRELPEFFYDAQAGEWSPITASLKKFGGKGAPVPQILSTIITGKTLSGFEAKELRKKEGWERVGAIAKYLSSSWLPFSFSALKDERKQWDPIQFAFPTSKGMTAYKTRKYMKTALQKENLDHLRRVWEAAIENNIPEVHKIFDQAVRELMYDAEEEFRADLRRHGITEEELDKIDTPAKMITASKEVQRLIRKKKALERQRKLNIMEKKIEGYLKKKKAMMEKAPPEKIKKHRAKLDSLREVYQLER